MERFAGALRIRGKSPELTRVTAWAEDEFGGVSEKKQPPK